MPFSIGQEVVCIDASPRAREMPPNLTKGEIYRVRGIDIAGPFPVIWLEGVYRKASDFVAALFPEWENDFPLDAARFRPISRKTEEISFTQGAPLDSKHWDNRHKVREDA